ncbi:MAG: hypothetical protein WC842_00340 [Candidatus Paceibacterota bacterium]|jgi:hypothetical protein
MPTKKFYSYNFMNNVPANELKNSASVFMNVPLSNFKRSAGCAHGSAENLQESDIGKKFDVEILDPVKIGICTLVGFGFDAIPDPKFREVCKEASKEGDNPFFGHLVPIFIQENEGKQTIIAVKAIFCDATPK